MDRRRALAVMAASTMTLLTGSGCGKKIKTKVVFINGTNQPLSIDARAQGKKFKENNLRPGRKETETYKTQNKVGDLIPITGILRFKTVAAPVNIPPGTVVVAGRTNTFTVAGTIAGGAFVAGPNLTVVVT